MGCSILSRESQRSTHGPAPGTNTSQPAAITHTLSLSLSSLLFLALSQRAAAIALSARVPDLQVGGAVAWHSAVRQCVKMYSDSVDPGENPKAISPPSIILGGTA